MALHTELPIYRTGVRLLSLAVKVQEQMPRSIKRILGDKIIRGHAHPSGHQQVRSGLGTQHRHKPELHPPADLPRLGYCPRTLHASEDAGCQMNLHQSANSYFGLLRQASHSHHDRTLVANVARNRGHLVAGDITKIFRRA